MQNDEIQTKEADIQNNDINQHSSNTAIPTDNSNMKWVLDNCADLKVDYDQSVLSTKSDELELVDYFFDSITCRR